MENYSKTKEEWETTGILESTPEDRKDKVVNALNIGVKWIIESDYVKDDIDFIDWVGDTNNINTMVPVVIVKILNKIDVTDEEILTICKEVNSARRNFDSATLLNSTDSYKELGIDLNAEFFRNFCDAKVNQLKLKS